MCIIPRISGVMCQLHCIVLEFSCDFFHFRSIRRLRLLDMALPVTDPTDDDLCVAFGLCFADLFVNLLSLCLQTAQVSKRLFCANHVRQQRNLLSAIVSVDSSCKCTMMAISISGMWREHWSPLCGMLTVGFSMVIILLGCNE